MFRQILIVTLLLLSITAQAQVGSSSPYSSLGFGSTRFYGNAYLMGLGGAATALNDSSQVNSYNPTTYSLIASQRPLFSLGLNHYETQLLGANGGQTNGRFTGITHLEIAIPFGNRFGLAFGLKPFARRGYSINDYDLVSGDTIHYLYNGKGAIYDVFLGFSANIIEDNHHTLTAGFNAMYLFGRTENDRRAYTIGSDDTEAGGLNTKALQAKSFDAEFGLNYNYRPNLEQSFRISGVYRPGINGNFNQSNTRVYYSDFLTLSSYDTVVYSGDVKGKVYIPSKLSVGFTYVYTPSNDSTFKRAKYPSYLFTFEYSQEDWSGYNEQFNGATTLGNYADKSSFRFGFEYSPYRFSFRRSNYNGFFSRLKYRVGAYWIHSPYQTGGKQLVDKGVTIGFGIPLLMHRSVSTLNLSFNYGEMGGGAGSNAFKERYYGVNIGFNIAPGYDKWFQKYKLD